MKFKKVSVFFTLFLLVTSLGITAAATNAANYDIKVKDSQSENLKERPKLTDEQKAKLKARHEEMKAKWNALTGAQKEEIYSIKDKQLEIQNQLVDKYLALGIIDKQTADIMKSRLSKIKMKMRENGKMPLFGRRAK